MLSALPAQVATLRTKRLRLRILAVAGWIVRTARRRILKIDPAWPWADVITTAHARLMALPAPLAANPHPRRRPRSTGRPR